MRFGVLASTVLALSAYPVFGWTEAAEQPVPTFTKDVMPILQERCQTCHRPGEIAPMSLMSFQEVRPWPPAIRETVLGRATAPWHADTGIGELSTARRR